MGVIDINFLNLKQNLEFRVCHRVCRSPQDFTVIKVFKRRFHNLKHRVDNLKVNLK
jgi:hypothetical protein